MQRFKPTILHWALLLTAFGLTFAAPVAWGQDIQARLGREIEMTDDIIEQAHEIVHEALGPLPRQILNEARELQRRAKDAFLSVDEAGNHKRAAALTIKARKLALRAIEITKAQRRLLERVRQLIAENRELVARARDLVAQSGSPEAERLLDAGLHQFSRGQRAFHNREFRQAVRLTLLGRDLVLRAIRIADGGGAVDRAAIRDELERTDQFLREAKSWVDDDRVTRVRYEEAERLQEQARRHLRADRLREARRFTLNARDAAIKVLRVGSDAPQREDVVAAIDRVAGKLEVLGPELRRSGESSVVRLVNQAERHLKKARDALADGAMKIALAETQLAASLLGQAEDRNP